MSGDLNHYTPGATASVRLVADGAGEVAERGDAVELVGESRDGTPEVALSSGGDATIGHLAADALKYDEDETYDADEVVGDAGVNLRHFVDWFETDADLAVADFAAWADGGGVRALDEAGGDTPADADVVGPVFRTVARGEYRADKVAVVRHR